MANEGGEWIMHGLAWNDPLRIRSAEELANYIDQVGFLPLFANEIPGFSAEDHVSPNYWWTGDKSQDPWEWREQIAGSGRAVYGKFFSRKAGFVSLDWYPAFANCRRDGYDFDARWDDELATNREKKIMDVFEDNDELFSFALKDLAGFGKDGEKNFEGIATDLQMKGYLVIRAFRRRNRKKDGREYGWPISVYTTPEKLLGADKIAEGYRETPEKSLERIVSKIQKEFPSADADRIKKMMK